MNLPPFISRHLNHESLVGIAVALSTIFGVFLGWVYTPEVLRDLANDMSSGSLSSSPDDNEVTSPSNIVTPAPSAPEPAELFDSLIVDQANQDFANGAQRLVSFDPNVAEASQAYMILDDTTIRYYSLTGACSAWRIYLTETPHVIGFGSEETVPTPECGIDHTAIYATSKDFTLIQPIGNREIIDEPVADHF